MLYAWALTELAYNYSSTDANQFVLTRPTISRPLVSWKTQNFGKLKNSFENFKHFLKKLRFRPKLFPFDNFYNTTAEEYCSALYNVI